MSKHYSGGYYLNNEPIIRGFGPNAHTANDTSSLSEYTVEAVNLIQETPWQVNKFVIDVVTSLESLGQNVGYMKNGKFNLVLMFEEPSNPKHDPLNEVNLRIAPDKWSALDKVQKNRIKQGAARIYAAYESDLGTYRATKRLLSVAREMAQFDKFYFPHNMDFRTRIYPIPTDLNPQSSDLSKGLLRFARGTRLGKEGVFWLAVTCASQWGEDKLSMDDRFRFASDPEFFAKCCQWVDDPLVNRGWLEADSPFQFLATAHEWVWANRNPSGPEAFVSYLPGNLDGSCNGAQHLSIMSRDLIGATATNCRNLKERNDLYLAIADKVLHEVRLEAEQGNLLAQEWLPKLLKASDRRGIVKRSVMTVPYGVTEYGVADFMVKDGHVAGMENEWNSAKYMRDKIMAAIEGTMVRGRVLQKWFQQCAIICAENGKALIWDTPAGSKVAQAYRNVIERRVRGFETRFVIYAEPEADETDDEFHERVGLNVKKMGTSAPPNVVHSCDASHLQITTVRMAQAGIRDFSMIHDSFGCPMAYVGWMRDILRQSIVDMYEGNYLQQFKESVEKYTGLTMPDIPELGEFDINEILESEYFFS